jgi:hypothetical protein
MEDCRIIKDAGVRLKALSIYANSVRSKSLARFSENHFGTHVNTKGAFY